MDILTTQLPSSLDMALLTVKNAGYRVNNKIELPVIKTGILMSPAEIVNGAYEIIFLNKNNERSCLYTGMFNNGKRIPIDYYDLPELCYKDIHEEIDYAKIPIGKVIKCISSNDEWIGYFKNYNNIDNSIVISFVSPFAGGNTRNIDLTIYRIEVL